MGKLLIGLLLISLLGQQMASVEAMWFHELTGMNQTMARFLERVPRASSVAGGEASTSDQITTAATTQQRQQQAQELLEQAAKQPQQQQEDVTYQQSMSPFSIAGIRPSSIASLLNTVSDTGFSYFNVHDQCRSRTACDVGNMLYKKLNFVHNWIIRASVRTLVDPTNVYSIAWTGGMMGKNCTIIYPACSQSPLDSIMNFAFMSI